MSEDPKSRLQELSDREAYVREKIAAAIRNTPSRAFDVFTAVNVFVGFMFKYGGFGRIERMTRETLAITLAGGIDQWAALDDDHQDSFREIAGGIGEGR